MTLKELLDASVENALVANHIVGKTHSYKADNKVEASVVLAYLQGGPRPVDSKVITKMGKHLVPLEDARRNLPQPPTPSNNEDYTDGKYSEEIYGR